MRIAPVSNTSMMQSNNILLGRGGIAKLADVGLAEALLTKTHLVTNSPRWAGPYAATQSWPSYSVNVHQPDETVCCAIIVGHAHS